MSWQQKARERLQSQADEAFRQWSESRAGKRWKARRRKLRGSPYDAGFSLPEVHHDLIEALNRDDEKNAKSIMMWEMKEDVL